MRDGEALLVVYEAVGDKGAQVSGSRGGRKRKKHRRMRRISTTNAPAFVALLSQLSYSTPHLVTPRQRAVHARADLEQKLELASRVRHLDDFFRRCRNVRRGESQFDDGRGLFMGVAEHLSEVSAECDYRNALKKKKPQNHNVPLAKSPQRRPAPILLLRNPSDRAARRSR